MKFRLDTLVLETGEFSSRTRTIESIENGGIKGDSKFILKPGKKIDEKSPNYLGLYYFFKKNNKLNYISYISIKK